MLALRGCRVIITGMSTIESETAIQQMKDQNEKVLDDGLPAAGEISYVVMDLGDFGSVKAAAQQIVG